jgi:hypothetical protein
VPTDAEMGLTKEFLDELALMNKQRRSYYRKKHFKKLVDSNALTREQADLAMASIAKYKNIVGGERACLWHSERKVLPATVVMLLPCSEFGSHYYDRTGDSGSIANNCYNHRRGRSARSNCAHGEISSFRIVTTHNRQV